MSNLLNENENLLNKSELKKYAGMLGLLLVDIRLIILNYSKLLSSLANVDGAILINDRFELLGFGVEIQSLEKSFKNITLIDNENNIKNSPIEKFGNRHKSAFRFVQQNHDSFILLSSQDGGMKCIGFDEKAKNVTMWEF
jgi:hypothetical protein